MTLMNQRLMFTVRFLMSLLYARTMQQALPLEIYEWNETVTLRDILATSDYQLLGFLCKSMSLFRLLYMTRNDFPLAPEKIRSRSRGYLRTHNPSRSKYQMTVEKT